MQTNLKKYVLVIDQGTTSTRSVIYDASGKMVSFSQIPLSVITPKPGWIEQDPEQIWESVINSIKNVLLKSNISVDELLGIGITNQRETTILWDKLTGKPLYNAIVWQSRQSQEICDEWEEEGLKDKIYEKTGLIINPYFSASKIKWVIENVDGIRQKIENGEVAFGTIDSFLIYRFTGNHFTDFTNASRTMMFNIKDNCFDEELCGLFNIDMSILPKPLPNDSCFGEVFVGLLGSKKGELKIISVIGDQQSALFGQCCFDFGDVKNTYGTGCFILTNTGNSIYRSNNGLLSTIGWNLKGKNTYALEGSVFVAGSGINWLKDELECFESPKDIDHIIKSSKIDKNVYFVPAFVGLGTPYWDSSARGTIFGITKSTTKADITCAMMNSIALQCYDVVSAMMKEFTNIKINYLAVDGGISVDDYLMQYQSDILNIKLSRPFNLETTSLGCCYLALYNLGVFNSFEEIKKNHQIEKVYTPHICDSERNERLKKWAKAIEACRIFK